MTEIARKIRVAGEGTVRLRSSRMTLAVLSAIFLLFGFWILIASFIFVDSYALMIGALTGAVVLLFTLIFFVSPMLNDNILTPTKLIVRYGILFKLEIPIGHIEKVEPVATGTVGLLSFSRGLRLGIEYSLIDHRYSVLRSKRGMVRVSLNTELTVDGWFSQRRLDEIVFDTLDSKTFIERMMKSI
jgi:hypothetical protein